MAIQAGQSIGRYHIIEPLGKGGMAMVYRAYDTRLKKDVAVKFIRRDAFSELELENVLARFDQEAVSLARLTHPNIIPIIDYDRFEDTPYLVMPFISGGTLKDTISRMISTGEVFSPAQAAHLLIPVANALEYAHRRGVLHRDVKPANILMTETGEPMLSDFGIARILDAGGNTLTTTGMGIGTPEYSAPEQWLGKPEPASDQYALGVVLYEMLTGRRPYTADTPQAVMLMHINDPLPGPRQFTPNLLSEVEKILFTALAKQPQNRFSSMAEFAQALETLIRLPTPKTAPTQPEPSNSLFPYKTLPNQPPQSITASEHPKKRAGWIWAAGLGGLAALMGVGMWLAWGQFSSKLTLVTPTIISPSTVVQSIATILPTQRATNAVILASTKTLPPPPATLAVRIVGDPKALCGKDPFGCATIAPGQTIKIGMGAPMTGDNAHYGIDISQSAKIAIADGGIIDGFNFELLVQDDGGTPEGGASVARRMVSDPSVVAIAGHILSVSTGAAIPVYEKVGIPMISPSSTNLSLTTSGSKVFNRIAFTDTAQGRLAAEYLYNRLEKKKIAVMHDTSPYGTDLANAVANRFRQLGGVVVAQVSISPGKTDYSAQLALIAAKNPEALYFGGYLQEAIVLTNEMPKSGLNRVVFFGCDGTFGKEYIQRTDSNGEGAYAVSVFLPPSDARARFEKLYLSQYGVSAGSLSPYTWNGYDSTAVLISVIKTVAFRGSDGVLYIPRGALVNAVRNIKDYKGLTGIITCDSVGECSPNSILFYHVSNGQWVSSDQ